MSPVNGLEPLKLSHSSCDSGSVMVVKKKAARVEAVVLDSAELKSLTSE